MAFVRITLPVAAIWCLLASIAPAVSAQTSDDSIVVRIGERTIRLTDVEAWWQKHDPGSFADIHERLYAARKRALDALIGETLVLMETQKTGETAEELFKREVSTRIQEVSEAEIKKSFEDLRSTIPSNWSYEQAQPVLIERLGQQRRNRAQNEYLEGLWLTFGNAATINFQRPRRTPTPATPISPTIGSATARVHIVEFGDFECQYCRQIAPVLRRLVAQYGDRVQFTWRDYPLPIHRGAALTAEAARCSHDQGRFWEFHDALFTDGESATSDRLLKHAEDLGLDLDTFSQCIEEHRHRQSVSNDVSEGQRLGLVATPVVLINGRPIVGSASFEMYERVVIEELESGTARRWRIGP
jgi:predicted DsbA family dithiol-disulfide isomerase